MKVLTKLVEGQRTWTKESIFKILKFAHDKRWDSKDLVNFLNQGLQEANFVAKKPFIVSNKSKNCWILTSNGWRFHVWVWVCTDNSIELKIGTDQYNDLGDLIYLWDKVRSSWEIKKSTSSSRESSISP